MATLKEKANKVTERKTQVKDSMKKIHDSLIKTSEYALTGTINAGQQWQTLVAKTIKKSEPVAEKNIDILFDTAEKIREGVESSATRVKDLLGIEENLVADIKEKLTTNGLYKRFRGEVEEIVEEVIDTPIVIKAKKAAIKAKVEVEDAIEDIKQDVTEVAQTIKEKVSDITGSPVVKDDLKVINGIGPKLETILNERGIHNYADLAKSSHAELQKILDAAGPRHKKNNPADWKAQAKLALANKTDELKA